MLRVIVPEEQYRDDDERERKPVLEFHYLTPPFMSPSGPVHPREANSQLPRAIIPTTVNVIANANTIGWSSSVIFTLSLHHLTFPLAVTCTSQGGKAFP